jgi:outer membrane protein OmpA-like peptidoglycan-associated protein
MTAREAVQTAEDARLITLKSQADARIEQERTASAGREANANARAADARASANDAERAATAAQAQTDRTRLDAQAAAERAAADARAQAERTKLDADHAAERSARDRADAAVASEKALKTAAENSEHDKKELRSKLATQLNLFLDTRDSARGLIVNMSDVLFDSGQFSLKAGAREKLAKISGIVLAYPTLKLQVEGYTDSVGSDDLNMRLSENRAGSVRDFLVQEGIVTSSISSHGFGKGQPVATNDTAAGRQQNRRVELIVSGDVIGTKVN